jgi:hypothetical protein
MQKLTHRIRKIENDVANRPCPDCRTHRPVILLQGDQPVPGNTEGQCQRCGRTWGSQIIRILNGDMDARPRSEGIV